MENNYTGSDFDDFLEEEGILHEIMEAAYDECPECHMKTLEVTAHCSTCINCGYSLCGI